MASIPLRNLGKTEVQVSALGMGGHHLGDAPDEKTAVAMVHEAVDGGITFYDNCWEYHLGRSEEWLGKGLKGRRDKAFVMTKVCTHGRDGQLGLQMLEESLRRLGTDHLDLWQIHGVTFDNDPELFARKGGAAEALTQAKKQGKVRFVGFTGHKDPGIHMKMLQTNFPFDAVQMPLNPFDGTFRSFETAVIPEAARRGVAVLGMKPLSGKGEPIANGVFTPQEGLRYAMSLPVATVITGMDKPEILRQNLKIAQEFQPMSQAEMQALRDCCSQYGDGRYELYKVSLKYDNPEARMAHGFPVDGESKEMKEKLKETSNTGKSY